MSRNTLSIVSLLFVLLTLTVCRPAGQPAGEPVGDVPVTTDEDMREPTDIIVSRFDCTAVDEIAASECEGLVAFYDATGGSAWSDNSGWLETKTPCSWTGVSCVDGHVDMLALLYNNLEGQLPAGLAKLSMLRVLDLHNNALNGEVPGVLGSLSTLEALDLSGNHIYGEIPETLGDLPALQMLSLAHNQLSGAIPQALGNIATLRNLDLGHNQLRGAIPNGLAELSALETLRLVDNNLDGQIPFGLGQLPSLTEVDLSFNQLTGSAPSALQEIAIHRLWGNQLDGTILVGENGVQIVNYLGATFACDRTVTDSVWAELAPSLDSAGGPGIPWSQPQHVVFTLVREAEPQNHAPMGLYVPSEAQIYVYPTAELNPEVLPIVKGLRTLLAQESLPVMHGDGESDVNAAQTDLSMLPPSNARQTLWAQVKFLRFADGRGVRYLTQLSQGPGPINNHELFYTFQGLSNDGKSYVAAYFPVRLPSLPDSPQMDDEALQQMVENWERYLTETVELLNEQPATAFTPDLAALDALIGSLSVSGTIPVAKLDGIWPADGEAVGAEPVLQWVPFADAERYEVVVVDDDSYPPVAVVSQYTADTVMPVAPALAAGSYSWTVWALDGSESVLAELNRTFLVRDKITVVAPRPGATVNHEPLLQWEAYPSTIRYQVIVLDDDAYPPVVMLDETTSETALATGVVLKSGSYSWTVWALDAGGMVVAELNSQFQVENTP